MSSSNRTSFCEVRSPCISPVRSDTGLVLRTNYTPTKGCTYGVAEKWSDRDPMWDHMFLVAMSTSASVFPRVFKIAEANNDVSHALLGYAYHRTARDHCRRENCLSMTYGLYDKEGHPVVISGKEYHRMVPVIEQTAWSIGVVPMVMSRTLPADRMGSITDGPVDEPADEPPAQVARTDGYDEEQQDLIDDLMSVSDMVSDYESEEIHNVHQATTDVHGICYDAIGKGIEEDDLDSLLFGEFVYK